MADVDGWKWYAGDDESVYRLGPCDTREEAIELAKDDQIGAFTGDDGRWKIGFHIIEARKEQLKLSHWIQDVDAQIDYANDDAADSRLSDPDGGSVDIFDATPEQRESLRQIITAAVDAWQARHGLVFEPFVFSESRNHEYVEIDLPNDD